MLWYLVSPRNMSACPPPGPVILIFQPGLFPPLVFHEGEQAEGQGLPPPVYLPGLRGQLHVGERGLALPAARQELAGDGKD